VKVFIPVFLISVSFFVRSQEVEVINASGLQERILHTESQLTVFNFWATWCGPCVKELPYFDEVGKKKNVKVYLVSLDFQNQLEKVSAFVAKKSVQSDVLFLNEKNPEAYMEKVSKEWTGSIPATLFVTNSGKIYFHESIFAKEDLERTVNKYLN